MTKTDNGYWAVCVCGGYYERQRAIATGGGVRGRDHHFFTKTECEGATFGMESIKLFLSQTWR